MRKWRAFLPVIVLLLGYGFVLRTREQTPMKLVKPLDTVLSGLEGYRIKDQKVSDEERRIAGMSDYVARVYYPGQDTLFAFTTLVSYYERQAQGSTIHSPRNCLPGAGWEILSGGITSVSSGGIAHPVNRFILKNGPAVAVAYYWYQGRGRVAANEYRVKWHLLRDAALLGHTEEALVRIVVPVRMEKSADAAKQAQAYANADSLAVRLAKTMITDVAAALPVGPTRSASAPRAERQRYATREPAAITVQ
jgi:EpsI family protein